MSKRRRAILIIIISFIFITMTVIAAVSGKVRAWFTSALSSKQYSFTSGTVMIKCNESISAEMADIGNLYPGWMSVGNLRIENSGTLDLQYRMRIDTDGLEGNPLFEGEQPLNISIMKGDSILRDYTGLKDFGALNMGSIKKGGYDNLIIILKLPEDADDSCQGKSVDLNFIFDAKQEGSGSAYPGETLVSSITITSDDGTFQVNPGKSLKLSAHVEPQNAACKDVIWSVQPVTGNAAVNQSGTVEAVSNGSVKVRASAADSSGVFQEVTVDVQGVSLVDSKEVLKTAMENSNLKTIDVSSRVYNIEGGVLRKGSAQDVTINCRKGEAIVNIIKGSSASDGYLPQNIKAGIGVTINENVMLVRQYSYVQTAINNATPNSIIAFEGGLFRDNNRVINISKPLTLIGIQSCNAGFQYSGGAASARTSFGSEIGSIEVTGEGTSNTTIMGLDFISETGVPVTVTGNSSNVKIVNNVFKSFPVGGINFSGSCSGITIQGNAISGWKGNNTAAINMAGILNNDISINNNYICEGYSFAISPKGIMLSGGNSIRVNDNIIENTNDAGILFNGNGDTIECRRNIINNSACGIQFVYGAPPGISSISISNNKISESGYAGIQVKSSGISGGAVKDLNIYGNTIIHSISPPANAGLYRSVSILLGKQAVQHGTINVFNNNLKIYGAADSVPDTCCLMLEGKLNIVNISGNVFRDESNCSTSNNIAGIHIVNNDPDYGPIPEGAIISDNLQLVNNFDVFNGIKILDERKP